MDIFSQRRFAVWAITLLVILNLFSLAALWFTQAVRKPAFPPPPQHGPGEPGADRAGMNVADFLTHELVLSPEQKEAIENLRREHFEERQPIEREIRDTRRRMMKMLLEPGPDMKGVQELAGRIGEKQARLEILAFEHFQKIKSLCGAEQSDRFDELLREILDKKPPHDPPPEGRPPHSPPPPRDRPHPPKNR